MKVLTLTERVTEAPRPLILFLDHIDSIVVRLELRGGFWTETGKSEVTTIGGARYIVNTEELNTAIAEYKPGGKFA